MEASLACCACSDADMHWPCADKGWLYASRYRPEAGFTKISRSGPEHEVPNGGFSHDVELKSFGSSTNKTYIQFQPPSLVRYFTPRDDGTFSARSSSCVAEACAKMPWKLAVCGQQDGGCAV